MIRAVTRSISIHGQSRIRCAGISSALPQIAKVEHASATAGSAEIDTWETQEPVPIRIDKTRAAPPEENGAFAIAAARVAGRDPRPASSKESARPDDQLPMGGITCPGKNHLESRILSNYGCPGVRRSQVPPLPACASNFCNSTSNALLSSSGSESLPSERAGSSAASSRSSAPSMHLQVSSGRLKQFV
jgi:hypothetical protein